jgi:ABC-2 type transport system permease protein
MVVFYGVMASWAFQFVTAIPLVLSILYYSADLRLLLTLPLRPRQIVAAKGILLYAYCFPVNLLLLMPALCVYAGHTGLTAALAGTGLVQIFLTPLLPLALASLFVIGLTKIVNLSRFRLALEVAGMALGVALLIAFQVFLSRTTLASVQGGSPSSLAGLTDTWAHLERLLPPLAWAARGAVAGSGPVPILLDLLATSVMAGIALALAPLNFLHDVMERREVSRRVHRKAAFLPSAAAPRGVTRQLVGREWAILSSNSTFIFEAIGELLVLPLVLGVYGLILPRQMTSQAVQFMVHMPVLSVALMGVLVLMTSLATVSSTSLSREGPRLGLSLLLPIAGRVQVKAKLVFHLLFFSTAYIVDLAIVWVLFRFPPVSLVFMIPGGIALQVVAFIAGIFFDLKRPLLTWTHPQQAMKNNANALTGIGSAAAITVAAVLPFALLVLGGFPPFLGGCFSAGLSILLAAVLLPRLMAFADRQFAGGLEMGG